MEPFIAQVLIWNSRANSKDQRLPAPLAHHTLLVQGVSIFPDCILNQTFLISASTPPLIRTFVSRVTVHNRTKISTSTPLAWSRLAPHIDPLVSTSCSGHRTNLTCCFHFALVCFSLVFQQLDNCCPSSVQHLLFTTCLLLDWFSNRTDRSRRIVSDGPTVDPMQTLKCQRGNQGTTMDDLGRDQKECEKKIISLYSRKTTTSLQRPISGKKNLKDASLEKNKSKNLFSWKKLIQKILALIDCEKGKKFKATLGDIDIPKSTSSH